MSLIADRFTSSAARYDATVRIQPVVAAQLAARLSGKPKNILEIGCGTGGLSAHLLKKFPTSDLVLSDISPAMLALCRKNIGKKPKYLLIDADNLPQSKDGYDLIVSSLALQWVRDLPQTIKNLTGILNPGGRLAFALLGDQNFKEWRLLMQQFGIASGLHDYPSATNFCWPAPHHGTIEEAFFQEHHENGAAFLKSLKQIGAATPRAGHKPVSAAIMKQALKVSAAGFSVSYHVLYGDLVI